MGARQVFRHPGGVPRRAYRFSSARALQPPASNAPISGRRWVAHMLREPRRNRAAVQPVAFALLLACLKI